MKRAVFLDRDGTIARDVHYCRRPEDFELFSTAPEAIRSLREMGYIVVIITNQSGIARGYFTEGMLGRIHKKMLDELAKYGTQVDAIYYCPHHPDEGCDCRKPKPKLILKAAKELGIDLRHSYMVGDTMQDVKAGKAAGCKAILLNGDANVTQEELGADLPDHIVSDLMNAVRCIADNKLPKVSVVIPAYNEEANLAETLDSYISYLSETATGGFQIIVVCNGCTDNTPQTAREFSQRFTQVTALDIPERIGKGGAIREGFRIADGDIISFTDADNAVKPDEFWKLVQRVAEGADGAIGSRRAHGAQIIKGKSLEWRFASRSFSLLVRFLFGLPFRDTQCGVKVFKRDVVQRIVNDLKISGMTFDVELLYLAKSRGYEIAEVPVIWGHKSKDGPTNDLLKTILKMAVDITKLRLRFFMERRGK